MNTETTSVVAANEAFYAALEAADLDALERLWVDAAFCVHPGLPPIHGRKAVLRSWRPCWRQPGTCSSCSPTSS